MKAHHTFHAVLASALLLAANSAFALTCGQNTDPQRLFTIDPAASCSTGQGNPNNADILGYYPGAAWVKLGDITGGGDNSAFLSANLTSGAWGSSAAGGDWTLSLAFWQQYGDAVISMHAGNGTPEHAAFLLTDLTTSGTFNYQNSQRGGGFSNFILWGRGPAICTSPTQPGCGDPGDDDDDDDDTDLPEPGTLALLGLGLMGLRVSRRRQR